MLFLPSFSFLVGAEDEVWAEICPYLRKDKLTSVFCRGGVCHGGDVDDSGVHDDDHSDGGHGDGGACDDGHVSAICGDDATGCDGSDDGPGQH